MENQAAYNMWSVLKTNFTLLVNEGCVQNILSDQ